MNLKILKLLLCLILVCFSCGTDNKVTFLETQITSEDNFIVSINIPKATGANSISENINETINSVVVKALNFGESRDDPNSSIEEQITRFNNEYNSFKSDFPDSAQEWEAQIDGDIMYESPEIISIALTSYINTGGAHGILTISFLNFNTETGLLISNTDLFNDVEAIKNIAKSYFKKVIDENNNGVFDDETFELSKNIGFEEDGIVMLYNVYEIAAYSDGIIQFTIPYSEVSNNLKYH